jgi:hypothetical protein
MKTSHPEQHKPAPDCHKGIAGLDQADQVAID